MKHEPETAPGPVVFGLALIGGAIAFGAFLSYRIDGAYTAWQAIGAGVVVLAGVVLTRIVARGRNAWATSLGLTGGVALPWAWVAVGWFDSQFYLTGLAMLIAGGLIATIVLTAVTDLVLRPVQRRQDAQAERLRAQRPAAPQAGRRSARRPRAAG